MRRERSNRKAKEAVPAAQTRRRIVVVDDDVVVAMTLTMGLEDTEVIEATRRGAGFQRIRETLPDAVIVDRRMPDGDGLQLVRKIREDQATDDIPVIVLTAGYDEADRPDVEAAGADAYLAKPFDPDELLALVEKLIRARPPRKERPPAPAPAPAEPGDEAVAGRRRTPLRAVSREGGTGLPPPGTTRVAPGRPAVPDPGLARQPAPAPAKVTVDAVALGAAVARAEDRASTAEADNERLRADLEEAKEDKARLVAMVESLEAELALEREARRDSTSRGQHLFAAAEDLQDKVGRAEADAQMLREQLVEARAAADEAEQLRREISKAYADIEVLEQRLADGSQSAKRPAPTKKPTQRTRHR